MGEDQHKMIEQGRKQLLEAEAEKRRLYDRTIGGRSMPRPAVSYIKDNVGKQKSEQQIEREAFAHVYPKMRGKAADAWVVKNEAAARTAPDKLREVWAYRTIAPPQQAASQKLQQAWSGNTRLPSSEKPRSTPEQLREAWNMKADPSRAQKRDKQRERGGHER